MHSYSGLLAAAEAAFLTLPRFRKWAPGHRSTSRLTRPAADDAHPAVSDALQGVASKLPGATRVFCGHEYTVGNLQFAKSVEPDNVAVSDKLDWSTRILAKGGYTVPSTASRFCAS